MDEDEDKSNIISFKKDVIELKIPQNYDALPVNEEGFVEFIVEME